MMRVTIYHNLAEDDEALRARVDGYRAGDPLVPVFAFLTDELPRQATAVAWMVGRQAEPADENARPLAASYQSRRLRPLRVGDAVAVEELDYAFVAGGEVTAAPTLRHDSVLRHGPGTSPLAPQDIDYTVLLATSHGEPVDRFSLWQAGDDLTNCRTSCLDVTGRYQVGARLICRDLAASPTQDTRAVAICLARTDGNHPVDPEALGAAFQDTLAAIQPTYISPGPPSRIHRLTVTDLRQGRLRWEEN